MNLKILPILSLVALSITSVNAEVLRPKSASVSPQLIDNKPAATILLGIEPIATDGTQVVVPTVKQSKTSINLGQQIKIKDVVVEKPSK